MIQLRGRGALTFTASSITKKGRANYRPDYIVNCLRSFGRGVSFVVASVGCTALQRTRAMC